MLEENIVIEADVCRDILNGLLASYARYGRNKGINLKDNKTELSQLYYKMIYENRKTRFYKTEEEVKKCKELINLAKENFQKIGGSL